MKYNSKFYDQSYILKDLNILDQNNFNIAIHIHINYIDMVETFIKYLEISPIYFDLLISIKAEENEEICRNEFRKLSKLNNLYIKMVPENGRDIYPWLVSFKEEQKNYDLVCHIHTKKSLHTKEYSNWAEYLFNNLISKNSITNIVSNFIENEKLGMVFPPIYPELFHYELNLDEMDKINMCKLLNLMNIDFEPDASNFLFPAGNMLWYRPKALEKLFNINLSYEDIPPEPLPNVWTILHAIERITCIVCEDAGYICKSYLDREEALNSHFACYDLKEQTHNMKDIINIQKEKELCMTNEIFLMKKEVKLLFNLLTIKREANYLIINIFGLKITIKV